ncbi:MAG: hypothetical protein JWR24_3450, partial [Actinoallomurus sp.]|nr:hypothetical protein [Actinoallomurus sp.]
PWRAGLMIAVYVTDDVAGEVG